MTSKISNDELLDMLRYTIVTDSHGNKKYFNEDGELHRDGGPAFIWGNGAGFAYFQHDQLHRTDGPAIQEMHGEWAWYQNDKLHREDGPAIVRARGLDEWWIEGERIFIPI